MNNFIPRSIFKMPQKIQWFPGHMRKGIRDIGKTLKSVDCILEVHDARIPFSGRNLSLISRIANVKPMILLLNKSDLLDKRYQDQIVHTIQSQMAERDVQMHDILFIDSITGKKDSGYNKKLINTIISSVEKNTNASSNRSLFTQDMMINLLIMGIPNVGKSTIINRFRNLFLQKPGRATIVGPQAGVTKAVLERIKITENPRKMFLYDTPGILEPDFSKLKSNADLEAMMRCAVCGNISDGVIGPELIVDYMLYWWNKRGLYEPYMEYFSAPGPTNDVIELLSHGAVKYDLLRQSRCPDTGERKTFPDFYQMSTRFLKDFRAGQFGPILLDDDNEQFVDISQSDQTSQFDQSDPESNLEERRDL